QLQAGLEQLGADHHRHRAADEEHHQREHQVQRADVLVVGGVEPALEEALLVLAVVAGMRGVGMCHVCVPLSGSTAQPSPPAFAVAVAAMRAAPASSPARWAASQAWYSAFGTALTTIGMKPWSLPHSSAQTPR